MANVVGIAQIWLNFLFSFVFCLLFYYFFPFSMLCTLLFISKRNRHTVIFCGFCSNSAELFRSAIVFISIKFRIAQFIYKNSYCEKDKLTNTEEHCFDIKQIFSAIMQLRILLIQILQNYYFAETTTLYYHAILLVWNNLN